MFFTKLLSEMPAKKQKEIKLQNKVVRRFANEDILGTKLKASDIECLKNEVNLMHVEKPNYFGTCFFLKWCFRRKK